jgi:hypothetical protein
MGKKKKTCQFLLTTGHVKNEAANFLERSSLPLTFVDNVLAVDILGTDSCT